jgi:Mn-dependent DtxR family transcriptional regulator
MNTHSKKILQFIRKERVVTSSEVAKFLKVSWNTADKYLLELVLDKKIERIKKLGVTLWVLR